MTLPSHFNDQHSEADVREALLLTAQALYADTDQGAPEDLYAVDVLNVIADQAQCVVDDRDRALRSQEHTQQWYGERWVRLTDELRDTEHWERVCNILANGTAEVTEPPTYAQQLNIAKYRAAEAERRHGDALAHSIRYREFLESISRAVHRGSPDDRRLSTISRLVNEALATKDAT